MKLRHCYLLLAIVGTLLPYSQFLPWVAAHGLNFSLFFHELFSARISAFFALDVIVSAMVLIPFILLEGQRMDLSRLWLPVIATLFVGVSLGLPLFLYMRQSKLDQLSSETP